MSDEEKITSTSEWNERSQELTLVKQEKLPVGLSEIDISTVTGDIVIENCLEDEEPSYKATAIVKAKKEEKARKEYPSIEEVYDINVSDTSFGLTEKGDKNEFSGGSFVGGNIVIGRGSVVSGGGVVTINGHVVSGGSLSGSDVSITKKVVLRIRPEQAKNLDLSSVSGYVEVAKIKGRGRMKTISGSIEAQEINGDLTAKSVSGEMSVDLVDGVASFDSTSGEVRVGKVLGGLHVKTISGEVRIGEANELNAKTVSGSVSVESLKVARDSSVHTVSGRVSVAVKNTDLIVRVSSTTGRFRPTSEFVVDKKSDRPMGVGIKGHFGGGSNGVPELDIETTSGAIDLKRGK